METCANCGSVIGNLETPYLHDQNVVCRLCWEKLRPGRVAGVDRVSLVYFIYRMFVSAVALAIIVSGMWFLVSANQDGTEENYRNILQGVICGVLLLAFVVFRTVLTIVSGYRGRQECPSFLYRQVFSAAMIVMLAWGLLISVFQNQLSSQDLFSFLLIAVLGFRMVWWKWPRSV